MKFVDLKGKKVRAGLMKKDGINYFCIQYMVNGRLTKAVSLFEVCENDTLESVITSDYFTNNIEVLSTKSGYIVALKGK